MGYNTRETAEDRRASDAVTNARHRIADIAGTFGTNHPEYATGLNQLALLLIMQGEPQSAEPLLRQALDIRRQTLGTLHPDYATNLSSLGGLLWARGDLDQAEPMLREALEVRTETLGPRHPKSVVSLNSLEQLLKAKRHGVGLAPAPLPPRSQAPVPSPTPVAAAAPPAEGTEPLVVSGPQVAKTGEVAGIEPIAARLERLRAEFAALGDQISTVGERLRTGSVPLDDALSTAWTGARNGFARLRRDAVADAEAHAVTIAPGGPASLADLDALTPLLRAAEAEREKVEACRAEALRALDRVDRLLCPSDPAFAPLADCREQARVLRRTIEAANAPDLPDISRPITDGSHPLVVLLRLVTADDSTTDAEWADGYDAVASAFGDPLGVAVARSRIAAGAP